MKTLLTPFMSSNTSCEPLLVHVVSSLVGRNWDATTSSDIVEIIDLVYAIYNRDMSHIMKFMLKNKNFQNCAMDRLPKLQTELAALNAWVPLSDSAKNQMSKALASERPKKRTKARKV